MTDPASALPEIDLRLHRALLEGMIGTGAVPGRDELVVAAGIDMAELPRHLAALAAADYLSLAVDGGVACLYPFSPVPTSHVVVIGGSRRYAMCSIDALGIAAMLGQVVEIEGVCGACAAPIRLGVVLGTITRAKPPEVVVLARRSGNEPACETCCSSTLFACGPAHGAELTARLPETVVVPLEEAVRHAESIFGALLGETLPAQRRRSQLVGSRLQT